MTEAAAVIKPAETTTKPQVLELPAAEYPIANRILTSNPLQPTQPETAMLWQLGEPHPMVPDVKVVRMYIVLGVAVEVYGVKSDGTMGIRNTIPWGAVRCAEEIMDPATFIDEVSNAESESRGGEEPPAPAPNAPTNGAAA